MVITVAQMLQYSIGNLKIVVAQLLLRMQNTARDLSPTKLFHQHGNNEARLAEITFPFGLSAKIRSWINLSKVWQL